MRTLIKTSMIGCMVLAIVCMTAPLGYTGEFLCANCGVDNAYPKCPPGINKPHENQRCYDVKDIVRPNWSLNFRSGASSTSAYPPDGRVNVSLPEDPSLAYGLSPAWSNGAPDESTACHKCGAHFTTDSRIKALATQP